MKILNSIKIYLSPWQITFAVLVAIVFLYLSYHYSLPINVWYWIAVSIISSYIFYFIVIRIKEVRDKKNIDPVVAMLITRFINGYHLTKKELSEGGDNVLNDPLSKTSPLSFSNNQKANWFEYFSYIQKKLDANLKQLIQLLPHLDTQTIKEIVDLQDQFFFQQPISKELPIEVCLIFLNELEPKVTKLGKTSHRYFNNQAKNNGA